MKHLEIAKNKMPEEQQKFIEVSEDNQLKIQIQQGSVKENGVNGIQALDLIRFTSTLIKSLDMDKHSIENSITLRLLNIAVMSQVWRKDRIQQNDEKLSSLQRRSDILAALEDAGVDNWSGYEEAMDMLEE